jgi:hypothetical protein
MVQVGRRIGSASLPGPRPLLLAAPPLATTRGRVGPLLPGPLTAATAVWVPPPGQLGATPVAAVGRERPSPSFIYLSRRASPLGIAAPPMAQQRSPNSGV